MTQLLQIDASLAGETAASTGPAAGRAAADPSLVTVRRDLERTPRAHRDAAHLAARRTPASARTPQQAAVVATADSLIAEVVAGATLVIAAPMHNFAAPSGLNTVFDDLARAGGRRLAGRAPRRVTELT
jgi:FMN-dependent NADH-azoreductase